MRFSALVWVALVAVTLLGGADRAQAGCNPNPAWQDRYPSWNGSLIAFQREQVGCGPPNVVATVSADGMQLRFWGRGTHPSLSRQGVVAYTSWDDGMVVVGHTPLGPGTDPTWSPGGDRLAFLRDGGLWVVNADGSGEQRLTAAAVFAPFSEAHLTTPSWSPDGSEIAFVGPSITIWVVGVDGGRLRQLNRGPRRHVSPAWSPDGSRIAFVSDRADNFDVWTIDPQGANPARLTDEETDETLPAWSPTGDRLAFLRASRLGYGKARLWVMARDGSDQHAVAEDAHGFSQPAWSHDGTRVVFATGRECLRWGLYVTALTSRREARITNRCRFEGTAGPDRLTGSEFNDFLYGFGGDDRLLGLRGPDTLAGGDGDDVILSGWGGDRVLAGPGADIVDGSVGFDTIVGGTGRDRISGGRGKDTILARDGWRDVVACGAKADIVYADPSDAVAADCERVWRR